MEQQENENKKKESYPDDLDGLIEQQPNDELESLVTHAMITPDGTAVPIHINPETGEYTTADGQPLLDPDTQQQLMAVEVIQQQQDRSAMEEDTSDLSSLAAAAEAATSSDASLGESVELGQVTSIGELLLDQPTTVKTESFSEEEVEYRVLDQGIQILTDCSNEQQQQPQQQQQIQVVNSNIRILNSDGTITSLNSVPQRRQEQSILQQQPTFRIVNADGTALLKQPQQIRIVNDPPPPPPTPSQPLQQIRVLNADGTFLSGNVRVISSNQIHNKGGNNQRGLINSPIKTTRIVKSPVKPIAAKPPKTVIIGSSQQQVLTQTTAKGQQHQIIHIPSGGGGAGNLQMGSSKVQYVRVVNEGGLNLQTKGAGPSVKIALPPKQTRVILPSKSLEKITLLPATMSPNSMGSKSIATSIASSLPKVERDREEEEDEEEQATPAAITTTTTSITTTTTTSTTESSPPISTTPLEATGVRPRKPCNCTKSQCLKLYCDCFANGEFCFNCNCNNCFNNLAHEEDRQKSIKSCLDRNPNAFRPKIGRLANDGERRHNKGCNCKRSGCLKNYCECYEAKIPCTDACRCIACKNLEDMENGSTPSVSVNSSNNNNSKSDAGFIKDHKSYTAPKPSLPIVNMVPKIEMKPSLKSKLVPFATSDLFKANTSNKHNFSFVTDEVVGATCQCLLAQAEEAEKGSLPEPEIKALILEEFGRCLKKIIEMSNRKKN